MTLRIDVNVPPRLIELAREQQVERRLAKAAEQRQAVVRKEAARQVALQRLATGKDAKGNEVRGGALEDQRRRWFGATGLANQYKITGCVFSSESGFVELLSNRSAKLYNHKEPGQRYEYTIPPLAHAHRHYTGFTYKTDRKFNTGTILLPAGGDAAVLYRPRAFSSEETRYGYDTIFTYPGPPWDSNAVPFVEVYKTIALPEASYDRAFFLTKNQYREITPPPNLGNALDVLYQDDITVWAERRSYGFANGMSTGFLYDVVFGGKISSSIGIGSDYTDNNLIRFFYQKDVDVNNGIPADMFYDYEQELWVWSGNGIRNEVPRSFVVKDGLGWHDFWFTWDSGRPQFCRQSLLNLGFSPEDLTL